MNENPLDHLEYLNRMKMRMRPLTEQHKSEQVLFVLKLLLVLKNKLKY